MHCLQSRSSVSFIQLLHGYVLSMSTDALRRCSPTMQSATRLDSGHESLLRERQISVMPSSLHLWSPEVEIGCTGQCLYLVRYCSQTTREFACFLSSAWDGRICLPRSKKGMFVYFISSQNLGKANAYSGPTLLTTCPTNFVLYTDITCTRELCSGGRRSP